MADFIMAVLLRCKVKHCAKMDHESLKLTIRHLYNPDGKAGQIRPDNFPCKQRTTEMSVLLKAFICLERGGAAGGSGMRESWQITTIAFSVIMCKQKGLDVCLKTMLGMRLKE